MYKPVFVEQPPLEQQGPLQQLVEIDTTFEGRNHETGYSNDLTPVSFNPQLLDQQQGFPNEHQLSTIPQTNNIQSFSSMQATPKLVHQQQGFPNEHQPSTIPQTNNIQSFSSMQATPKLVHQQQGFPNEHQPSTMPQTFSSSPLTIRTYSNNNLIPPPFDVNHNQQDHIIYPPSNQGPYPPPPNFPLKSEDVNKNSSILQQPFFREGQPTMKAFLLLLSFTFCLFIIMIGLSIGVANWRSKYKDYRCEYHGC